MLINHIAKEDEVIFQLLPIDSSLDIIHISLLIKPVVCEAESEYFECCTPVYRICVFVLDLWHFVCEGNYKIGLMIHTYTLRPLGEKSRQPWCWNVGQETSVAANIMLPVPASLYVDVCILSHVYMLVGYRHMYMTYMCKIDSRNKDTRRIKDAV